MGSAERSPATLAIGRNRLCARQSVLSDLRTPIPPRRDTLNTHTSTYIEAHIIRSAVVTSLCCAPVSCRKIAHGKIVDSSPKRLGAGAHSIRRHSSLAIVADTLLFVYIPRIV